MAPNLSPLQVNVARDGVIATVTINGELDLTTAAALLVSLLAVADEHPDRIVLDLSGLVFVDVAGARALDEAYRLLQIECPVILRNPRPPARKVFRIMGLMAEQDGYLSSRPALLCVADTSAYSRAFAGSDAKRGAAKYRCPAGECKSASVWLKADGCTP